jgi:MFS family permease
VVGSVVILLGWTTFATFHDSIVQLVLCSALCTLGGSIVYAAIPNLVVEVAPPERTAELNGMSHVFRTVGTAIGTQMVTLLLATSSAIAPDGSLSKHPTPEAFMLAFGAVVAATAIGVIVALALPSRSRRQPVGGLAPAAASD